VILLDLLLGRRSTGRVERLARIASTVTITVDFGSEAEAKRVAADIAKILARGQEYFFTFTRR